MHSPRVVPAVRLEDSIPQFFFAAKKSAVRALRSAASLLARLGASSEFGDAVDPYFAELVD